MIHPHPTRVGNAPPQSFHPNSSSAVLCLSDTVGVENQNIAHGPIA